MGDGVEEGVLALVAADFADQEDGVEDDAGDEQGEEDDAEDEQEKRRSLTMIQAMLRAMAAPRVSTPRVMKRL